MGPLYQLFTGKIRQCLFTYKYKNKLFISIAPITSMQQLSIKGHFTYAVGVMEMGNSVPRAGIEPTFQEVLASVLALQHVGCGT